MRYIFRPARAIIRFVERHESKNLNVACQFVLRDRMYEVFTVVNSI